MYCNEFFKSFSIFLFNFENSHPVNTRLTFCCKMSIDFVKKISYSISNALIDNLLMLHFRR